MNIFKIKPTARWLRSEWGYPDRTLTCSRCGFEYDSTDYNSKKFNQKVLPNCPKCRSRMRMDA